MPKPAKVRREGELSEYQALGLSPYRKIEEIEITRAIKEPHKFSVHAGSTILLVQSGAEAPERDLLIAMASHFKVTQLSGMPDNAAQSPDVMSEEYGEGGSGGRGGMGGGEMGGGQGMGGGMRFGSGGGSGSDRLDKALRLAAANACADTVVVVWTKSPQKHIPCVRAAVMDVATGRWEIISPIAIEPKLDADGKPAKYQPLPPEEIKKAFNELADALAKGQ